MDINSLISVVGFVILSWIIYGMKNRLDTQKSMFSEYKSMLDSIKSFTDIFDLDKVNQYVTIREETIKAQSKKDKEESEKKLMILLEKEKAAIVADKGKLSSLLDSTTLTAVNLFMYVPPELREEALQKSPDGPVKRGLSKDREIPFLGVQPEVELNALRELFNPAEARKGIKSNIR